MPSLSQLRLRADRVNNRLIELQSDLRGIERRIRILDSRAVGGNSRTVRQTDARMDTATSRGCLIVECVVQVTRDMESALLERDGVLGNISEAKQALNNLDELIKLHDGHSAEGSCSSTPSKKRPGALQQKNVPTRPATQTGAYGSSSTSNRMSGLTTRPLLSDRAVSRTRSPTRCEANLKTDKECVATCTVATSMTSFPPSSAEPCQPPGNTVDGPLFASAAAREHASKATSMSAAHTVPRSTGDGHQEPHPGMSACPPGTTSPLPAMQATCFHLPLPPRAHDLSPPLSNLSTPAASPTHHNCLSSPAPPDLHHPSATSLWPQPDPSAAVQTWLAAQSEYRQSPTSPASIHSVPAGCSPSQQHLNAMHLPPGHLLPTRYHPQPLQPVSPLPPHSTWYSPPHHGSSHPPYSPQPGYPHSPFKDHHLAHAPAQPAWMQQPAPIPPGAVDTGAADVRKVESWLRAVGRARGWDLRLLDDLLAQDLAAVLASDSPSDHRVPHAERCRRTEEMHAWSNPLALQNFVAECAGRPRSGRRVSGTADTLVTAVQKHLLRRPGATGAHQHADVLRQSFDLLERGAARSGAYAPASQRREAHGSTGVGRHRAACTGNGSILNEEVHEVERDDSFPGFQRAAEDTCWNREMRPPEAVAGEASEEQASVSGVGAARGSSGGTQHTSGMVEEGNERATSGQQQQDAVPTPDPSPRTDSHKAHVCRPSLVRKCGKGVKVAQSRKAVRQSPSLLAREYKEAASTLQAHGGVLPPLRSDSPVALPVATRRDQKPGCRSATTSSVSPVAAALRPPRDTADTDTPLLALAKRVTIQSHRLPFEDGGTTLSRRTALQPFQWLAHVVKFFVRIPWRRPAPAVAQSAAGEGQQSSSGAANESSCAVQEEATVDRVPAESRRAQEDRMGANAGPVRCETPRQSPDRHQRCDHESVDRRVQCVQ